MKANQDLLSTSRNTSGSVDIPPSHISVLDGFVLPDTYLDGSFNTPHQMHMILRSPRHRFSNIFLGPGTVATIGSMVMNSAVKAGLKGIVDTLQNAGSDFVPQIIPHVEASKLDRSSVELTTIRNLIENHYMVKIHPLYPVVDLNDIKIDVIRLGGVPSRRRFVILMSAAISAACLSRQHPIMYNNALILRHWADELAVAVLAGPGAPRLQEFLLLILYELIDPTRRLIWNLLGLACRMCVKLGWHRNAGAITPKEPGENQVQLVEQERRTVLFIILYGLERQAIDFARLFILLNNSRRVCQALGRPTILPDISIDLTLLPPLPELSNFHILFVQSQLKRKIYEASGSSCPFSSEIVELINRLDSTPRCDVSWLLLYPIQQHTCDICSTHKRWEPEIERAAISKIDDAYEWHRARRTVSVWLEATEVFIAGAILVDLMIRRRFLSYVDVQAPIIKSVTRCISLLTSFAESWPAGGVLSHLFEKLSEVVLNEY